MVNHLNLTATAVFRFLLRARHGSGFCRLALESRRSPATSTNGAWEDAGLEPGSLGSCSAATSTLPTR